MLIETAAWFEYWATIIMLFGLSLLSRAVFLVAGDKIFGDEGALKKRSLTLKSLKNYHMTALLFFDLTIPCPRMFAFIAFIRNEVNYLAATFWC
jgi:hypothetical protein